MSDEEWFTLRDMNPGLQDRVYQNLKRLASGHATWAELLQVPDDELLGIGKRAAAAMDVKRYAEAEEMFVSLTKLDPYVPWFWLSLGDARMHAGNAEAAIQAYKRCVDASSHEVPPLPELRSALFRRGDLFVQLGRYTEAFEDFRRVVELDTDAVLDGERAYLALQQMSASGQISPEQLQSVTPPRRRPA